MAPRNMRKRSQQPTPKVEAQKAEPPKVEKSWHISMDALSIPYQLKSSSNKPRVDPFFVDLKALHPPTVHRQPMAMDDVSGYSQWATQRQLDRAAGEGLSFIGYPVLSEMAQRNEYRRMSEVIARHMTRKWIRFKSKSGKDLSEKIKQIEETLTRLNAKEMFKKALEHDAYFGRGHVYLELCDLEDRDELRLSVGNGRNAMSRAKIQKGQLVALRTLEPVWCSPHNYNSTNPLHPHWYRPQSWYVMDREVSASRMMTFITREVPDLLKPAYSFGGLSLSQMVKPYVDNWLRIRQSVADIINSFSIFVLKTNLLDQLQGNEQELVKRLQFFNALRDNTGLLALDMKNEDFANVAAPLGSLDLLQAQAQEHMSAASGIPIVELLGVSPAGLNASSEGEMETFREWMHACQESSLRPNLEKLIGFVQLSEFGEVDEDITFDFEKLESLDEGEIASRRKTEADTDSVYVDLGVLSPDEIREKLANDEESPYNGIDLTAPAPGPPSEGAPGEEGGAPFPDPTELAKGGAELPVDAGTGEGEPDDNAPAPGQGAGVKGVEGSGGGDAPKAAPNAPEAPAGAAKHIETSIGMRRHVGSSTPTPRVRK